MNETQGAGGRPSAGYQLLLVALLSFNFGIVFFDRNALSFLMPFVQPELGLDNFQVGLIGSAMALTWAAAGVGVGVISDRVGARKAFLIGATIIYSLCSFLSGLAETFALLLGARMLMGAAEGSIAPISQSLTAEAVSERRRGVAMGAMQTLGAALLGSFLAPIILVDLAQDYGWRNTFYIAGAPGLVTAALLWVVVKEPPKAAAAAKEKASLVEAISHRNVIVCTGMAILLVSYMLITWNFMPLVLTQDRGLDPGAMSWVMSVLGLSAAAFGLLAPALSDRIGRRPVLIVTPALGVILPLAALYGPAEGTVLAAAFFAGWALAGTFAMFMATVPAETVPARYIATAMGFVMGMGEAVGGVGGPALAGAAADAFGRDVILWTMMALCLAAAVLAFGLKETAPAVVAKRAGAGAALAAG
jgi:MFS family permease